jgi:isopentenyl-diphosphate delta-isomerase
LSHEVNVVPATAVSHDISQRKADHIALCADPSRPVAFKATRTLFDDVRFIHDALPDLALDDIDLTTTFLGHTLSAPVFISAMTGGTEEAAVINKDLARIAAKLGLGMGLGSQRAMWRNPEQAWTYTVRDVAPQLFLMGNIGVVQAREMQTHDVQGLVDAVGANALCIHLNPAQEIVQPGGDRDFRGGLDTIRRLQEELTVPLVVKETGCGLSARVAQRLHAAGVKAVDTSGAGGTSWVGVETLRAAGTERALGEAFWEWGIPTAASVYLCAQQGLSVIATGGVQSGLDIAKAIALGATAGGVAAAVLRAYKKDGAAGAEQFLVQAIAEIRAAMLLTGSRTLSDLRRAECIVGGELSSWIRK